MSGRTRWRVPSGAGRSLSRAVLIGLAAEAIAIVVNIAVLDAFDAAGIVTARGGLQKLMRMWLAAPLTRLGVGVPVAAEPKLQFSPRHGLWRQDCAGA